jgi:hypothetical protein
MNSRPRLLPAALGAVAGYFLSIGIYNLLLTGSCSTPPGPNDVACPPGIEKDFFRMFGGIVGGMITIFLGGSWFSFVAMFVGIAAGAFRAGMVPKEDGGEPWFLFFGACFLIGPAIMLIMLPIAGLKRLRAARLLREGIRATGTVLDVADTGVYINGNPRLRVTFRIEPEGGIMPPYESTKTATVSRFATPRIGDKYPVWIDPDDQHKWMFANSAAAEAAGAGTSLRQIVNLTRQGAQPGIPAPPTANVVAELGRLNELRLAGAISAEEFASRTSQLLNAGAPA